MPAPVVAAAAPAALPWLGGALAAGGSIVGSIASGLFGKAQADKQMRFQERMAGTAHQREVEDLRRAGINPLLSARHGGAAAPVGSAAPTPDFGRAVSSAVDVIRMNMDAAMQAAQINDVNSAAALKDAQTNDLKATQVDRIELMIAQRKLALQSERTSFQEAKKIRAELDVLRAQRANIQAQTASTLADQEKKKFQSIPFEAGNKAFDWIKKFFRGLPKGRGTDVPENRKGGK